MGGDQRTTGPLPPAGQQVAEGWFPDLDRGLEAWLELGAKVLERAAGDPIVGGALERKWLAPGADPHLSGTAKGLGTLFAQLNILAGLHAVFTSDDPIEQVKGAVNVAGGVLAGGSTIAETAGAWGAASGMAAGAFLTGFAGIAWEVFSGGGAAIQAGKDRARADGALAGYATGMTAALMNLDPDRVVSQSWFVDEFAAGGARAYYEGKLDGFREGYEAGSKMPPAAQEEAARFIHERARERGLAFTSTHPHESYEWWIDYCHFMSGATGSILRDPPAEPARDGADGWAEVTAVVESAAWAIAESVLNATGPGAEGRSGVEQGGDTEVGHPDDDGPPDIVDSSADEANPQLGGAASGTASADLLHLLANVMAHIGPQRFTSALALSDEAVQALDEAALICALDDTGAEYGGRDEGDADDQMSYPDDGPDDEMSYPDDEPDGQMSYPDDEPDGQMSYPDDEPVNDQDKHHSDDAVVDEDPVVDDGGEVEVVLPGGPG